MPNFGIPISSLRDAMDAFGTTYDYYTLDLINVYCFGFLSRSQRPFKNKMPILEIPKTAQARYWKSKYFSQTGRKIKVLYWGKEKFSLQVRVV